MQSLLGVFILTSLSLFVLPPFVQVGVFTTRGPRKAFFIGAAVAGVPHFVSAVYFAAAYGFAALAEYPIGDIFEQSDDLSYITIGHLVGIVLGSLGGVSGVLSYGLLHGYSSSEDANSGNRKDD